MSQMPMSPPTIASSSRSDGLHRLADVALRAEVAGDATVVVVEANVLALDVEHRAVAARRAHALVDAPDVEQLAHPLAP